MLNIEISSQFATPCGRNAEFCPSHWTSCASSWAHARADVRTCSERGILAERCFYGREDLARFGQPELSNGLSELHLQRGGSAALARNFGLSLPLGLLHGQSDEFAAARFRGEAPGRFICFCRLLCGHFGGCPFVAFPSGQDI